jgi:hypothetical protein
MAREARSAATVSLLTPYTIYLKLGAAVAVIGIAAGGGFHVGRLSGDLTAANAKTAQEAAHAAQLSSLASAWQARELQTQAEDGRHDAELSTLKTIRSGPLPGVALSVCPSAPRPVLSAAGGQGAESAAGGPLPPGNGNVPAGSGDIRPGLLLIADEADDLLANCRETQPAKTQ